MKTTWKRFLSFILVLAICVSMIPASAFALEEEVPELETERVDSSTTAVPIVEDDVADELSINPSDYSEQIPDTKEEIAPMEETADSVQLQDDNASVTEPSDLEECSNLPSAEEGKDFLSYCTAESEESGFSQEEELDTMEQSAYALLDSDAVVLPSMTLSEDYVVDGNATVNNSVNIDLNGHTLTINGNLLHSNGKIDINGGKLAVTGDYRIQSSSYSYSCGQLIMDGESDRVTVGGSFYIDSHSSYASTFSAGTLTVAGDFNQLRSSSSSSSSSFSATGTHTLELNGSEGTTQHVHFDSSSSNVQNLVILGKGKVEWSGSFCVLGSISEAAKI